MRLTETTIKQLPVPVRGSKVWYETGFPGFGIRLTAAGVRSWILNYRIHGIERRLTIGRWPTWPPQAAREKARELRRQIDSGQDPLEARQLERQALTFAQLVEEFAERYAYQLKSGPALVRMLRRNAVPAFGQRKVHSVSRAEIIKLIETTKRRAPVMSNRLLSAIKQVYYWAIEVDLAEDNPAQRVKRLAREESRDRVLTPDEIRLFWEKVDTLSPAVAGALRLVLITGARPHEAAEIAPEELDLAARVWRLPADRTKTRTARTIPLTSLAIEQIEKGLTPVRARSLSQALWLSGYLGLPRFGAHDLRRTCASGMGELGVPRSTIGLVLGHRDRGHTRIYDRASRLPEMRAALERWDRRLREILGLSISSQVVAIR